MEILQGLKELVERDPTSGVLLGILIALVVLFLREKKLVFKERNTSSALALAASVVATFHPIEIALTKLVETVSQLNANTLQGHTLLTGLGQQMTAHETTHTRQYKEILKRIDRCQTELGSLVEADPTVANELARMNTLTQQIKVDLTKVLEQTTHDRPTDNFDNSGNISGSPVNHFGVVSQTQPNQPKSIGPSSSPGGDPSASVDPSNPASG